MSLNRYENSNEIINYRSPQFITELFEDHVELFEPLKQYGSLNTINDGSVFTETHLYTIHGDHIESVYDSQLIIDDDNNGVILNIKEIADVAGVRSGTYKVISNFIIPVLGTPLIDDYFFINEISPDRTELKLVLNDDSYRTNLNDFKDYLFSLNFTEIFNFLVLNLYGNNVFKIVNVRFDRKDSNVFYLKLYQPLPDDIEENKSGWLGLEVFDSYVDTITITRDVIKTDKVKLKGPNFKINTQINASSPTTYKNWNDIFDSNMTTSQEVIDSIFGNRKQALLNVDYTNFDNFVFYSSAVNRIEIFYEKVKLLEHYQNEIEQYDTTGSMSHAVKQLIKKEENRITKVKNSLDSFERWLYYQPTGSDFTHDVTSKLKTYPKYRDGNKIVLHKHDHTSSLDWYSSSLHLAKEFDLQNYNSLINSVPEYVLMDEQNSAYLTFIKMVGHHFDNLYMYINSLQKIHERDEHPNHGVSNQLLQPIAESFGWILQNSNSLTDIWKYKLGTNSDQNILQSNGSDIMPHEQQTINIWRRIVNNLPYLLKTKASRRSVEALMSIYGIPQTLISIKEYGGPGIDPNKPLAVSNKFSYRLNLQSGSYLEIPQDRLDTYLHGWGSGSICGSNNVTDKRYRLPDTYEFRFSTRQALESGSIELFKQSSGSIAIGKITLHSSQNLEGKQYISGSKSYGKILYEVSGSSNYSKYLPIFDGDLWTIRIDDPTQFSNGEISPRVTIGRVTDCVKGDITHFDEFELDSVSLNVSQINNVTLGSNTFQGSIQGYKEYFTVYDQDTFKNHVRNPKSYNTNNPSGSFYSLYRYYPLGLDMKRYDHSIDTTITSSHPDQKNHTPSDVIFHNFSGSIQDQYTYFNEVFYSEAPTIGTENVFSHKIRIEKSELKNDLNPITRNEIAEFDSDPIDSNRLVIGFSTADYVNDDIVDHMGGLYIDDWVGSPEDEFNAQYNTLHIKKNEYFQKYTEKNNFNALIRILSLYDYSFFNQLKQLVPAKADLISGILIEPHILERSKSKLTKKPKISTHHHEDNLDRNVDIESQLDDIKGDFEYEIKKEAKLDDIRGSLTYEKPILDSDLHCHKGLIVRDVSGSGRFFEPICDPHLQLKWKLKKCYADPYPFKFSINKNSHLFNDDYSEYTITGTEVDKDNDYDINLIANVIHRPIFLHGIRLDSGQSISQDVYFANKGYYVLRIFAISNNFNENSTLEMSCDGDDIKSYKVSSTEIDEKYIVKDYKYIFKSGYKKTKTLKVECTSNQIIVFGFGIYNYNGRLQEGIQRKFHEEIGLKSGCEIEQWYYQYNENSKKNNSRFKGSKLTGSGINIDSENTVDGGPVVEVRTTNPNNLRTGFGGSEGNLRVD